jgi:MFS family permease
VKAEGTTSPSVVAAVSFGAMAAGAMPLYAISALGPVLVDQLSVSRTAVGALTAAVFGAAAVSSVFLGRLADRRGARRTLAMSMVAGTLLALSASALSSYQMLFVFALAAGPLLAIGNPVTNRLIGTLVGAGRRGVVVGVKQSGVQASAVLAGVIAPSIALHFGWQAALAAGALVPIIVLAILPLLARDPRSDPAVDGHIAPHVAVSRGVRVLAFYAFLMGAGVSCVNVFLPLFVVERGILGPVGAGILVSVVGGAGVIARVLLSHRAERSGAWARWLGVLAAGAAAGVVVLLLAPVTGAPVVLAVIASVLLGTTATGWNAVAMLFLISVVSDEPGVATGWMLRGFYLGTASSPTLFGAVADSPSGYLGAWSVVVVVFVSAFGVMWRFERSSPEG